VVNGPSLRPMGRRESADTGHSHTSEVRSNPEIRPSPVHRCPVPRSKARQCSGRGSGNRGQLCVQSLASALGSFFLIGRLQPEISAVGIDPSRRTNSSSVTTRVAGAATSFQRHSRELPSTSPEVSLDELPCGKLTSTLQEGNLGAFRDIGPAVNRERGGRKTNE